MAENEQKNGGADHLPEQELSGRPEQKLEIQKESDSKDSGIWARIISIRNSSLLKKLFGEKKPKTPEQLRAEQLYQEASGALGDAYQRAYSRRVRNPIQSEVDSTQYDPENISFGRFTTLLDTLKKYFPEDEDLWSRMKKFLVENPNAFSAAGLAGDLAEIIPKHGDLARVYIIGLTEYGQKFCETLIQLKEFYGDDAQKLYEVADSLADYWAAGRDQKNFRLIRSYIASEQRRTYRDR